MTTFFRVLAVRTHSHRENDPNYIAPVDGWRIQRPLEMLAKKTGWQVDIVTKWIDENDLIEEAGKRIGETYNFIYTSYIREARAYALIRAICARYGCIHIMDLDDDMFHIPDTNPAKIGLYKGSESEYVVTRIIEDVDYIVTTNDRLAGVYRKHRPDKPFDSVFVIPNYIEVGKHQNQKPEHNKIVIGYAGGGTHHADMMKTGFLPGLKAVLRKYPQAELHCVGMPIINYKIPHRFTNGVQGMYAWLELFKTLDFDISTAPLENSVFNQCKSNIKWQEAAMLGAPLVASEVSCYSVVKDGKNGFLCKNERDWRMKLTLLVENEAKRRRVAQTAKQAVLRDWSLEEKWVKYKEMFEEIWKRRPPKLASSSSHIIVPNSSKGPLIIT